MKMIKNLEKTKSIPYASYKSNFSLKSTDFTLIPLSMRKKTKSKFLRCHAIKPI